MKLLKLKNIEEYKSYFKLQYCNKEIYTLSGIKVKFYEDQFEHAFFKSENYKKRDKSIFAYERAERMDWIKKVLQNEKTELYVGWDRDEKEYNYRRKVCIIMPENYVIILNMIKENKAKFITAYVASKTNAKKIRSAPKWENKKTTDYWFSSQNL